MIAKNLKCIQNSLPKAVTLVAVSKTKPIGKILEAYDAGQRIFGENKVQEMASKQAALPKDIQWHMIGHLQRNKVKYMASFVSLIHGVDNLKLLKEIDKQAKKHNRIIDCLLQVKIAEEESKFGFLEGDIEALFTSEGLQELQNIKVVGLMGMASFTSNQKQIKEEFTTLKNIFKKLKTKKNSISILSMGMSGDYEIAIDCGSNMVRVGSAIFGKRL